MVTKSTSATEVKGGLPFGKIVLDANNVTVTYKTEKGLLDTVRNVTLQLKAGEIYGLVGESGSGKSTLARAIVRYLPENGILSSGSIYLGRTDMLKLTKAELRKIWGGHITMVHQDPNLAINPSIRIGEQIAEVARVHLHMNKKEAREKALEMLTKVRIPDPKLVASRYAYQLSGGMLQRALIAIAMTTSPELLIMDEPTTALDVTTEAVILDLLNELMDEYNTSILYITHNLGVVARICDRVGVLYAGEIMEEGSVEQVFKNKLHPYTRALLGCVPRVDANKSNITLKAIRGHIPRPDQLPRGCIFSPRCEFAEKSCLIEKQALIEVGDNHMTACRRYEEIKNIKDEDTGFETDIKDKYELGTEHFILEARKITKYFPIHKGLSTLYHRNRLNLKAVDGMSVFVGSAFTLGIVGESGCGKTTFARCIAGLEEATSGKIILEGDELPYVALKRTRSKLKKIQMVFQNPDASLNPQHTVGKSVARPLALLQNMGKKQIRGKVEEIFCAVNLPVDYINRLPHELSGGEKQRVAIARALAADPLLVICDEPISSLDVSVQASLINLLIDLQKTNQKSYIFISHDLAAIRHLSDWIAVVYLGKICEIGPAEEVFVKPHHPYTEALLSALPIPDPDVKQNLIRLEGSVPSAVNIPAGCCFHTRCPRKIGKICEEKEPPLQDAGNNHQIRCHITIEKLFKLQSKGII